MSTDPSLDDALYLVEAHAKTGCMHPWAAFDYAHRVKGMDFDRMRRPRAGVDIDNRAKPLGDALTGIVLKDDSQIVDLRIRWADVEGVHITVRAA